MTGVAVDRPTATSSSRRVDVHDHQQSCTRACTNCCHAADTPGCHEGLVWQHAKGCVPCPVGSYALLIHGSNQCVACPPGRTTRTAGTYTVEQCGKLVCLRTVARPALGSAAWSRSPVVRSWQRAPWQRRGLTSTAALLLLLLHSTHCSAHACNSVPAWLWAAGALRG